MPAKGAEYALLQRKYQFENILQTVASHRERAREREIHACVLQKYTGAAARECPKWFRTNPCPNTPILS